MRQVMSFFSGALVTLVLTATIAAGPAQAAPVQEAPAQAVEPPASAGGRAIFSVAVSAPSEDASEAESDDRPPLGTAELSVKSAKAQVKRNKRVKVTVKGLAAGEKVTLKVAGKKAAAGKAGAKGTFTAKVKVGRKTGKAKLKAVGQFKNRSGATTVKVK